MQKTMKIMMLAAFLGITNIQSAFAQEDALYIDATGKVGIGIKEPKSALDVNGNISLSGTHLVYNSMNAVIDWGRNDSGSLYFRTLSKQGDHGKYNNLVTITNNGNLGIGTTGPVNKLQVEGNLHMDGNAIYLRQNPKDFYDVIKWSAKRDQIDVAGWNGVTLGSMNKGDTLTPVLTANGEGKVGIGTTSPKAILDVSTFINGDKLGTVFGRLTEGNTTGTGTYLGVKGFDTRPGGKSFSIEHSFYGTVNNSINFFRGGNVTGGFIVFNTGDNSERMIIDAGGRVGIGTTSPKAMLEVNGSVGYSAVDFAWLTKGGGGQKYNGTQVRNASILASGDICTKDHFIAYSDARIKKGLLRSSAAKDLSTLNKLQVTDYKYVDNIQYGDDYVKGFIAQEVEKVFPEAVSKGQDFVPDIFSAPVKVVNHSGTITFSMGKHHGLKDGDMVRLITKQGNREKAITVVNENTFSITDTAGDIYKEVFVYGKRVDDFRRLDYDRLFTLNVSATQQLSKEVEALKAENEQLRKQNAANESQLEKSNGTLTSVLSRLEVLEANSSTAKK